MWQQACVTSREMVDVVRRSEAEGVASMLDFIIVMEVVQLQMSTQQAFKGGRLTAEDMQLVNILLKRLDAAIQTEQFYLDNYQVMKKMATRSESGLLSSIAEFASAALANRHILREPEEQTLYQESFSHLESLMLKLSTGPVQCYDTSLTYDLFGRLLLATEPPYHQKLAKLLIDTIAAFYKLKEKGTAYGFKNKIIQKLSHLVGLLCQLAEDPRTQVAVMRRIAESVSSNIDIVYVVFPQLDSKQVHRQVQKSAELSKVLTEVHQALLAYVSGLID